MREKHVEALRDKDAVAAAMDARITQLTASVKEQETLHKDEIKRIMCARIVGSANV